MAKKQLVLLPKGKRIFSPAKNPVNILILGDGWEDTKKGRKSFWGACDAIAEKIFETAPFSILPEWINIFGVYTPSPEIHITLHMFGNAFIGDEGVYYHDRNYLDPTGVPNPNQGSNSLTPFKIYYTNETDDDTGMGSYDPMLIENFIKNLEYKYPVFDFAVVPVRQDKTMSGKDTWLSPEIQDPDFPNDTNKKIPNRSYGLVGIIVPNLRPGGEAYDKGEEMINGAAINHPFFISNTWDNAKYTFIHELAHNLNLIDEYEEDEQNVNPSDFEYDVWENSGDLDPTEHNILLKKEFMDPSDDISQGLEEEEIQSLRWYDLLSPKDIRALKLGLYQKHPHAYDANGNVIDTGKANDTPYPGTKWLQEVWLVEGAGWVRRNVFRSNFDCIMRESDPFSRDKPREFCKICHYRIIQELTGVPSGGYKPGSKEYMLPKP